MTMTSQAQNLNPLSTVTYIGGRLREAIQQGYPEVGWEGDPLMYPTYDPREEEWVVFDSAYTPHKPMVRKRAEGLRDMDSMRGICEKLRDAQVKGQGVQTIYERMRAQNAAIEASHEQNSRDLVEGISHELLGAIR